MQSTYGREIEDFLIEIDNRLRVHLTRREQEVLAAVLYFGQFGYRREDIAGILGISPNTLKDHLAVIVAKLDAGSIKELRGRCSVSLLPPTLKEALKCLEEK